MHTKTLLLSLALVLSIGCSPCVKAQVPSPHAIDENLFALYLLRQEYASVPGPTAALTDQYAWIQSTRSTAARMRQTVLSHGLDSSLTSMFSDTEAFAAEYYNFLNHRQEILKRRSSQTGGDALRSLWAMVEGGSKAQETAISLGASKGSAENFGILGGLVKGGLDYEDRSNEHDAEAAAAIRAESDRLIGIWQQTVARTQSGAAAVANHHGWSLQETGYDGFHSSNLWDYVSRMPQNPFALLQAATTTISDTESVGNIVLRAKNCVTAAQMIPAGSDYLLLRSAFELKAAELAVDAGSVEAGMAGYGSPMTPTKGYAEYLARKYIDDSGSLAGAQGYVLLARGLAFTGRYREALQADDAAFSQDASTLDGITALRHAQMLSLAGDQDAALTWIQKAYSLGFDQPRFIRAIGSFSGLQKQRPAEFEQLMTARLSNPVPHWGIINDDFEVTNLSPFNLTNVRVSAVVYKGGRNFPFQMSCPLIKAGASCLGENVVSIPGSSMDRIEATYTADQTAR